MRDAESWDVPLISFGYIPTLTTHRIPPTKYSLQAPHRSVQGAAVNPNVSEWFAVAGLVSKPNCEIMQSVAPITWSIGLYHLRLIGELSV